MQTRSMTGSTTARKASLSKNAKGYRVEKSPRGKQIPQQSTRTEFSPSPSARASLEQNPYEYKIYKEVVDKIFKTADWEFLCSEALKCYRAQPGASDSVTCEILQDRFRVTEQSLVLEVSFSDLTHWIVKISLPNRSLVTAWVDDHFVSQVATMRLVQERTSIPVPTVFAYNAHREKSKNPFGYHYIFMSSLPGRHPNSFLHESIPKQHQPKVAGQYADILHQLSTKMTFSKIGSLWCGRGMDKEPKIIPLSANGAHKGHMREIPIGPFSTSLAYFFALRQHENAAVRAGIADGSLSRYDPVHLLTACRIMEHGLFSIVNTAEMKGPFPLHHPCLCFHNVLVDDEFNITGVLGWSSAHTVPREAFIGLREVFLPSVVPKDRIDMVSSFNDLVYRAWEERISKSSDPDQRPPGLKIVDSISAQIIKCGFNGGGLNRLIDYAAIVGPLLYGLSSH